MYNGAPLYPAFQKSCMPYSIPIKYSNIGACTNVENPMLITAPADSCYPFGYQPKQPNPGSLKFHYLNYPFPNLEGNLKQHPGQGWNSYEKTGEYYRFAW